MSALITASAITLTTDIVPHRAFDVRAQPSNGAPVPCPWYTQNEWAGCYVYPMDAEQSDRLAAAWALVDANSGCHWLIEYLGSGPNVYVQPNGNSWGYADIEASGEWGIASYHLYDSPESIANTIYHEAAHYFGYGEGDAQAWADECSPF